MWLCKMYTFLEDTDLIQVYCDMCNFLIIYRHTQETYTQTCGQKNKIITMIESSLWVCRCSLSQFSFLACFGLFCNKTLGEMMCQVSFTFALLQQVQESRLHRATQTFQTCNHCSRYHSKNPHNVDKHGFPRSTSIVVISIIFFNTYDYMVTTLGKCEKISRESRDLGVFTTVDLMTFIMPSQAMIFYSFYSSLRVFFFISFFFQISTLLKNNLSST